MERFYVISNRLKDPEQYLTQRIERYLKMNNRQCLVTFAERSQNGEYRYTNPKQIPTDTECILVVGGDGTLLQAARDVVGLGIPLLGINMGHLGFLAEVNADSVSAALDKLMNDQYEIEERMMLQGTVYHNGVVAGSDLALNDIVIYREGALRVVNFMNYINGRFLNTYNADGVIASTPTGSTGYSLSCGGPLISPDASMVLMTPIAPHTLNARSLIFSSDDVLTVEIGDGRHGDIEKAMASFDGDTQMPMETGDKIVISKADFSTKIIKLNHMSFVEVVRRKMQNT